MAEAFGKNLERKYNEKLLKKLVSGSDYDIEEEAQLLHNIAVTKYSVKSMDKEKEIIDMYESSRSKALNILERIKYKINKSKVEKLISTINDLREYNENKKVITYKYTKIDKTGRHPLGQSVKVPYNTVGLINGTEEKKKKGI